MSQIFILKDSIRRRVKWDEIIKAASETASLFTNGKNRFSFSQSSELQMIIVALDNWHVNDKGEIEILQNLRSLPTNSVNCTTKISKASESSK